MSALWHAILHTPLEMWVWVLIRGFPDVPACERYYVSLSLNLSTVKPEMMTSPLLTTYSIGVSLINCTGLQKRLVILS